jgi:hypothetical protein
MYIGIIGCERVGKDTFADILVCEYGFKKYSMADPIREIAQVIFPHWQQLGVDKDLIDSQTGIRPRDFMKWIGTDIFQLAFHTRFPDSEISPRCMWSSICGNRIRSDPSANWVIPDIRFKHEAEELIQLGGTLINLYSDYTNENESQSSYDIPYILSNFKYESICNNKTDGMDSLKNKIAQFIAGHI